MQTSRKNLYDELDRFLTALAGRAPSLVNWHLGICYTENNVSLKIGPDGGDGLWNTITGFGAYDLRFADPKAEQVGLFTTIWESDDESPACIRLGLRDEKIYEVEILIVRDKDEALKFENPKFERKPILEEVLTPSLQMPRHELQALANGYFETLELNDGDIHTKFHPNCNRVENGVQTTNNQDFFVPVAHMGCEEQFKLGHYRYDDRLRGRRFPLIDLERGLVFASGFIDHKGLLGDYFLTDGTPISSPIRRPHTFYLMEVFKIKNGMIEQIEANFITVPYHMPSPWDQKHDEKRYEYCR